MKFVIPKKIVLFGGARLLAEFAQQLSKKIEVVVFSSKRHLEEDVLSDGRTFASILESNKIRYYSTLDINTDTNLTKEVTPFTIGIASGAAWVFEPATVQLFAKNHFLDYMGIDLPHYRGGAHYTWQILHGNKKGSLNLQVIHGGAKTFHRGEIVMSSQFAIAKAAQIPLDYFNDFVPHELAFLNHFIEAVKSGKEFTLQKIDESTSSYYPFLHTKSQGLINWSWSGEEIASFIQAFDVPYPGASTFLHGIKVVLRACTVLHEEEKYHPFTVGIVIRKDENYLFVATKGKLLRIGFVGNEKGENILPTITLGDRFFTPQNELDAAMQFHAAYDAAGLKKVQK